MRVILLPELPACLTLPQLSQHLFGLLHTQRPALDLDYGDRGFLSSGDLLEHACADRAVGKRAEEQTPRKLPGLALVGVK